MDSMPRSSRKSSAAFTPCSFVSSVLSLIRLLRKYEIYPPCFVTSQATVLSSFENLQHGILPSTSEISVNTVEFMLSPREQRSRALVCETFSASDVMRGVRSMILSENGPS